MIFARFIKMRIKSAFWPAEPQLRLSWFNFQNITRDYRQQTAHVRFERPSKYYKLRSLTKKKVIGYVITRSIHQAVWCSGKILRRLSVQSRPDTGCPHRLMLHFPHFFQDNIRIVPWLRHKHFLPYPYDSSFNSHLTMTLLIWLRDTDSFVK